MDRAMIERHLAQAEAHVALGLQHIARQIEVIANLERGGHATSLAFELLATFRDMQVTHEADRGRLSLELAGLPSA